MHSLSRTSVNSRPRLFSDNCILCVKIPVYQPVNYRCLLMVLLPILPPLPPPHPPPPSIFCSSSLSFPSSFLFSSSFLPLFSFLSSSPHSCLLPLFFPFPPSFPFPPPLTLLLLLRHLSLCAGIIRVLTSVALGVYTCTALLWTVLLEIA